MVCRTFHPAWAVQADEETRRSAVDQAGHRAGLGKAPQRAALPKKICAGLSLRTVFASLAAFLVANGLRTWVGFAVLRAWEGRQYQSTKDTGSTAYNFGSITADEMEALFVTLCCVLPHLVDRELRDLNTAARQQEPPRPVIEDPMPAMVVACGRLLTWYSNVQRPSMTYSMIMENRQEGVAVLQCLQDTFPIRNTSLKQWVAHVLKGELVASGSEGSEEEDSAKPTKRPWVFPKAHGMAAHVWATTLLYGDMANVSAQIIENMHVPVKDLARRSNGKRGWEAQAMTKNMRESELALKTWTPPTPTLDSDVESNLGIVGNIEQIAHMGSGSKSGGSSLHMPPSVGRAGVYATFRNGTSGTGLRYPVWKVIQGYAECTRILETPTTRQRIPVIIQVNSLAGSTSEWLTLCPEMAFLPRFLAKYVCDRFHSAHPQVVPDPSGKLSHKEIADLVNMVQVACVTQKAGRSTLPGSIASFNVLAIRHPAVAGQVGAYPFSVLVSDTIGVNSHVYAGGQMSVRAQPFSTYHGKICSDHVVFMPTWMPKRPRDVDLTKEEDCDMLSYGVWQPFHLQPFIEAAGGAGGLYLWACGACCVPHHIVS